MEEERERIKKGGMKTEVRGQWPEVGRATEAGLPFDGSSFTEEKLFVPERGSVLHAFSKDGFMVLGEGRLFATLGGFFALKRTAVLRIEMLKQVQIR